MLIPDVSKGEGAICLSYGRDDVAHAANNTDGYPVSQTEAIQAGRTQYQLYALGFQSAQFCQDG